MRRGIVLCLFFALLLSCPCKPGYVCYPGIGCVAISVRGDGYKDTTILDCGGVCINTTHTPTISCRVLPCVSDPATICSSIEDSNKCVLPPVIRNDGSCALQGPPIQCANSQTCLQESGCPLFSDSSPPPVVSNDDQTTLIIFFVVYGVVVVLVIAVLLCFLFASL